MFKTIGDILNKLGVVLSKKQKQYAAGVLLAGLISAILELLGVAVIIPILEMLLDLEAARNKWYISIFAETFNLDSDIKIVWFICLATIFIYLVKNIFFSFYSWLCTKYSMKVQRELSVQIMSAYLKQGYLFFVQHNTSKLLQGITTDVSGVYRIVNTLFSIVVKGVSMICIGVFIIVQSRQLALVLLGLVVFSFALIQIIFRKSMAKNGAKSRKYARDCFQIAVEAMQGNKEILVTNKQDFFVRHYKEQKIKENKVAVKVSMGAALPTYIIEMVCIGGILVAVAVQMGSTADTYALITSLSTVAVGAFRMLPALGGITSGVNTITSDVPYLNETYKTICVVREMESKSKYEEQHEGRRTASRLTQKPEWNECLQLQNVSFAYPEGNGNVLENVNLTIKKGESIGLIGVSGAGKTTLADIILGLLKPSNGKILLDGMDIESMGGDWNQIIGYVPQSLYILDDTIRKNVAFGVKEELIEDELVWKALKMAQLDQFVERQPNGLNTTVGEWGIRFSGGQRQRLAIARALYRNPEILVLDEATAALDNNTEKEVMEAIESIQGYKTLIIVAHRLSTVKKCDTVYEVKDKNVFRREKEEIFRS